MSSGATSAWMARSWPMVWTMGQRAISGSPSKYIWLIRRWPKPEPKTETWMCIGRQLLTWFGQG